MENGSELLRSALLDSPNLQSGGKPMANPVDRNGHMWTWL